MVWKGKSRRNTGIPEKRLEGEQMKKGDEIQIREQNEKELMGRGRERNM